MKNISIKSKLILLIIGSILVATVIVVVQESLASYKNSKDFISKLEEDTYRKKEEELKYYVEIAKQTVNYYYEKSKKDSKNSEKYKAEALEAVKALKFGADGYFWIHSVDNIMLMHPLLPEIVGKDVNDRKDVDGTYIFREIKKVISGEDGEGLVKYKTRKMNNKSRTFPKFSYVIKFDPWGFIIGTGAYVDDIEDEIEKIKESTRDNFYHNIIYNFLTIFIIIGILSFIILYVAKKVLIKPLEKFQTGLLKFFKYINKEEKDITYLEVTSNDEIGLMSKAINDGISEIQKTITQKNIEDWQKNGVTQLNEIVLKLKDIQHICDKSIDFICTYLNVNVGVFYIYEEENERLVQYASYAHVLRDELSDTFVLKEGVVGQVGFQKKPILLTNVNNNQSNIKTGLISKSPNNLFVYPLTYNNELFGVIEIGSIHDLEEKDISFFDLINTLISQALINAIQDKKVKDLLENTKKANDELAKNQEKLEEANAYMEEQQQQLEEANANLEEQQQQLEEANANMEEQQQQLMLSEQNLKIQNQELEDAKQELVGKAEELERSGKYKSEFLANMSHELRTPLNSIILLSSLLQKNSKKTLNNDDIKKAKTIHESGNELLRLINDILDLSKVESGKMKVIVDSFKSIDLLEQINDVFQYTAQDKGLDFKVIDEYNQIINSDRDRILQIIRNLVSNAFKFTSEGSITVKISPSKIKDFRISVIDTGIGIPQEKQELIFKAFTQADGSTSRKYGGTGLGLSITRELSKLLQGSVEVQSNEGIGSSFSVDLTNLSKDDYEEDIEKEEIKSFSPKIQTQSITTKSLINIRDDREIMKEYDEAYLIIDDDKNFAEVVYEEIKKSNNFVLVALNGKCGLELVRKHKIKGILLDLTLPDMDGIEVLKELKSNPQTKSIPVHIISSKDKDTHTLELGAIGYLQKPIYEGDIDNVISSIDSITNKQIKDLLIVEDDEVHREALIELIGEGVNITGVKTSKEAINAIKTNKFDTVLVDLSLFEGSGYEVCEFIKNSYPSLPIIIYTGKDLSDEEKKKLREYSNSIIIKTANSNERILNEINLFLHREKEEISKNNNMQNSDIDLSDINILIVDDDIKNIFVLDSALKEFNATTFTAFNGKEALEFIHENKNNLDVVLMDIMMPIMDGYEAIEKIREDDSIKDIPIIAVTAKAMKEDREKCISLGANDYVSKPIDIDILCRIIKQWSEKRAK